MEFILAGNHDDNYPHQHHHHSYSAPAALSPSSSSAPTPTPSPPPSPPLPISFGPAYYKYHLSSSSSTTSQSPPSPHHSSVSCLQNNTLPPPHHLFNYQQQNSSLDTAAPSPILKSPSTSSFSLEHITINYHKAHSGDHVTNTTEPHNMDTITTTSASSSCLKDLLEWLLLKCCRHCYLCLR